MWKQSTSKRDLIGASKCLAYVLRHSAVKEGIPIREDGYVLVQDILSKRGFKEKLMDEEAVKQIVAEDQKKRYEVIYEEDTPGNCKMLIRASQGHSMDAVRDEMLLKIVTNPEEFAVVVHGTYLRNWDAIKREGLRRMSRNHIHMAAGYPEEGRVISGARPNCDLFIEIDVPSAIRDGITFYLSNNNVILTKGVHGVLQAKYFKKVVTKCGQELSVQ